MARVARVVSCDVPHHVTQRGNNQGEVFFTRTDRRLYLDLLAEHARKHDLNLLAYCLMTNHVHLVAVPERLDSLAKALGRTHCQYAHYLNTARLRTGHLWQNRYYSCPLDSAHLWVVMRYVERNPVRAAMVTRAGDYEWSSARAHLTNVDGTKLLDMEWWLNTPQSGEWPALLEQADDETQIAQLRRCTLTGRPLGSEEFIAALEQHTGRPLRASPGGRPRRPSPAATPGLQLELEVKPGNT
jgi:putative transposase